MNAKCYSSKRVIPGKLKNLCPLICDDIIKHRFYKQGEDRFDTVEIKTKDLINLIEYLT